jgi:hypothetical protein
MTRSSIAPKRYAARLALAGTVVAAFSLTTALPASATMTLPDLVISKIRVELPGTPHCMALGHTGTAARFVIAGCWTIEGLQ